MTATHRRIEIDHDFMLYTKISPIWTKDLNIKPKSMKLMEENIDSTIFNMGLSRIFLVIFLQAREIKAKPKVNLPNRRRYFQIMYPISS